MVNKSPVTAEQMAEQFFQLYGEAPESVWVAPGRVNLIGDHTDYQGGYALPIALPYATWVAARRREDSMVHVATDYRQEHWSLTAQRRQDMIRGPRPLAGLAAFIAAVWEILAVSRGADLWLATEIPVASGLSSSAALSLGLLAAARDWQGAPASSSDLIHQAMQVENDYLGVDSGILDPMAIVLAQQDYALWIDAGKEDARPVAFDYAHDGQCLWVIDTHSPRTLASSGYQERVHETAEACRRLEVCCLSQASLEEVEKIPDPVLRSRSRHVVTENGRVLETVEAAAQKHWDRVKQLFWESHQSLRDDYGVSTPVLDATVARLKELGVGARLTGAGFGGSVIALGAWGDGAVIERELRALYSEQGWDPPGIMPVDHPARGLHRAF